MLTIQHRMSEDFFEPQSMYRRKHRFFWVENIIAAGVRSGILKETFPNAWDVILAEKYRGNVPRALTDWGLISVRNGAYVLRDE
jgi:hypothetical protein